HPVKPPVKPLQIHSPKQPLHPRAATSPPSVSAAFPAEPSIKPRLARDPSATPAAPRCVRIPPRIASWSASSTLLLAEFPTHRFPFGENKSSARLQTRRHPLPSPESLAHPAQQDCSPRSRRHPAALEFRDAVG